MDPALLIPTPDAIPVSWGWFQLLLLLTFFLHILLMNVMFGSAFIALVSHLRRNGGSNPCTAEISQNDRFSTKKRGNSPFYWVFWRKAKKRL